MDTCGNSNGVIINWVLCPLVMATVTTVSFSFAAVSMSAETYLPTPIKSVEIFVNKTILTKVTWKDLGKNIVAFSGTFATLTTNVRFVL